jgi:hypothetical protein
LGATVEDVIQSQIARTFYKAKSNPEFSGTISIFSRDATKITPMAGEGKILRQEVFISRASNLEYWGQRDLG